MATLATFCTVVPAAAGVTRAVNETVVVCPWFSMLTGHVTVPDAAVQPSAEETNSSPTGSGSLTTPAVGASPLGPPPASPIGMSLVTVNV